MNVNDIDNMTSVMMKHPVPAAVRTLADQKLTITLAKNMPPPAYSAADTMPESGGVTTVTPMRQPRRDS